MHLKNGDRLGAYVVLAPLGVGGMGEVYRARDERLGRDVALKVLPPRTAADREATARLEREARLLAALQHPHIAGVHGFESEGETRFLVMELIPGESLDVRLAAGPLTIDDALRLSLEIASALDAAHERGIVHRDLKPGNIMLRPDGGAVLLDFGLAKEREGTWADASGPTLAETLPGVLVGTVSYMSPEQARGRPADRRSDLWAWGAILFECLTGRKAFGGDTPADVLAAILGKEPEWSLLPRGLPAGIEHLVRLCLEKDPDRRLQSAGEARREILTAKDAPPLPPEDKPRSPSGRRRGLGVGAILEGILGRGRPEPATARRAPPRLIQETFDPAIETSPAWSPDGRRLAFCREVGPVRKIFVKDRGEGRSTRLTRGDHDDIQPAWTPDGKRLLFVRARRPRLLLEPGDVFGQFLDGDVWSRDLETGNEELFVEKAFHPAPSPDGTQVAVDATWAGPCRIWTVDARGRNPRQITSDTSEAILHLRPRWSPGGECLVFQTVGRTQFNIRTVRLADGEMTWLTQDAVQNVHPVWSPDGGFVFFSSYRGGGINLWRIPVTPEGAPAGPLDQVTTGAGQDLEGAISPDGSRLAFSILRQNADLWRLPVSPETGRAAGDPLPVVATTREESRGAWAPSMDRIAFNSDRTGTMNIWVQGIDTDDSRQLTRGPGGDYQPNWSPDGRRLAFFSSREGTPGIWTVDLGGGRLTRLSRGEGIEVNPFHSPDGARIAFHSDHDGRLEAWVMDADGGNRRRLTRVGVMGHFLRWSADGAFVYFRSPAGSTPGVFRVPASGGEPEEVPGVKGGSHLSLSPDGKRIMDVLDHKVLWVSPLDGGAPESVFRFPDAESRIDYPVWSPDGRWILFDRFRPQGGDVWVLEGFA